ncbi:WcaG Nucleoside-diphosphate-sugar epimerases [Burkholderiaceae bacterium]
MSRTLVTGATGFIGRRLLDADFVPLVRRPSSLPNERVADLADLKALQRACEDVTTVFHCAGYAQARSTGDADTHWKVNLRGTQNLLEASRCAGVKRFVFLSSVKAMAEPGAQCVDEDWPGVPLTPYGQAKRAAENVVLEVGAKYGVHVVILRLAMVYGKHSQGGLASLAKGLSRWWVPCLPETGNRRSLVHVDDVVDAIHLVAKTSEANGRTYIVADPTAYSSHALCKAIRSVFGDPSCSWSLPESVLRMGGITGDVLGALLRSPIKLNSQMVSRLLDSEHFSPERIRLDLGWEAKVKLLDGLREMLLPELQK